MLHYLAHLLIGALFLLWLWPKLALMFPAWHLPASLDYWECLTILWAAQVVSPLIWPELEMAVKKKGNQG